MSDLKYTVVGMGISGNLSTIGLPDVLQLLASGAHTGTLIVRKEKQSSQIYFQDGVIIYAVSSSKEESLLDVLVRNNGLSLEQAETIREDARVNRLSVESVIRKGNYVGNDVLVAGVMTLAKEIIYDLFQWLEGDFEFQEGQMPPGGSKSLSISLGAYKLIMEGSRRIDEWSRIRKSIPSLDAVFKVDGEPDTEEFQFSKEEWQILCLLDGSRDVRAVCKQTRKSEFEVCQMLYGFKSAGLIQQVTDGRKKTAKTKPKNSFAKPLIGIVAGVIVVLTILTGFLMGRKSQTDPSVQLVVSAPTSEPTTIPVIVNSPTPEFTAPSIPTPEPIASALTPSATQETQEEPVDSTLLTQLDPRRIDINKASVEMLQTLPRIGPVTASAIVQYRTEHGPFRSPQDIMKVPRIGPKTYEGLESLITCGSKGGAPESKTQQSSKPPQSSAHQSSRINLNTATLDELTALPGIGPSKAQTIIEYRTQNGPFTDPHQITEVRGIGEKSYAKMRDMIWVD